MENLVWRLPCIPEGYLLVHLVRGRRGYFRDIQNPVFRQVMVRASLRTCQHVNTSRLGLIFTFCDKSVLFISEPNATFISPPKNNLDVVASSNDVWNGKNAKPSGRTVVGKKRKHSSGKRCSSAIPSKRQRKLLFNGGQDSECKVTPKNVQDDR